MLGPDLIAVHAVHVDEGEIELLARHGSHVAHCPSSNLKLASGIAPVARYLDAGVNVGLGTDGAASNNRLDLFEEMRLAALLAKGSAAAPIPFPPSTALRDGHARTAPAHSDLEDRIGSHRAGQASGPDSGRTSHPSRCLPATIQCPTWSMRERGAMSATSGSPAESAGVRTPHYRERARVAVAARPRGRSASRSSA